MADENVKPVSCTWIHGVGSSTAVDTAGEIVDLAGLDCSSLENGAPFTWEHQNIQASQLVGKILEYKKIFSEADCENDHHKYFWDKCKNPYLYVMGRLFDDKKDSSKEVAALFVDDAEHPGEKPMVGFSVEGSRINKTGLIVDKSIARKITITNCPANKQCVAEIVKNPDVKAETDTDSIFKSEPTYTIELLEKYESLNKAGMFTSGGERIPARELQQPNIRPESNKAKNWKAGDSTKQLAGTSIGQGESVREGNIPEAKEAAGRALRYQQKMPKPDLGKKEVPGSKIPAAHAAPGPSKAVKGAPGWSHTGGGNFHHPEHGIVSVIKQGNEFHVKHKGALAGVGGKKGSFGSSKEAGSHAGDYMRSLSQGKTAGAEMHERPSPGMAKGEVPGSKYKPKEKNPTNKPQETAAPPKFGPMPPKKGNLKKAMSAGSGMAASGSLSGGAALTKESLDKKMKKAELNKAVGDKTKEGLVILKEPTSKKVRAFTPGMDKPSMIPSSQVGSKIPSPKKMKKAEWLARAEEAYQSWGKREQFENFMAKHMPDLAKGEVQALGQVLALRKSLRAEKKLAKMVDQGQDSYVNKSDKK